MCICQPKRISWGLRHCNKVDSSSAQLAECRSTESMRDVSQQCISVSGAISGISGTAYKIVKVPAESGASTFYVVTPFAEIMSLSMVL